MQDVTLLTATELADAVNNRKICPLAIAEAFIARLESINPRINAFVYWNRKDILGQATTVIERLTRGEKMPLAGVPVGVKDNLWVEGWPATQGSLLFKDFVAPNDTASVSKLREAGAIILGMANCPEFACWGFTDNKLSGVTRNPWDTSRTPGGSSGGSASAVAARLCPIALGTDAGGSIRRPASHTGTVGFMPSSGTVPSDDSFQAPAFGNNTIGVFARVVEDIVLAMEIISPQPLASNSSGKRDSNNRTVPDRALRGSLKIGFSEDLGLRCQVESDVARSVSAAVERLRKSGADITRVVPAWPDGTDESRIEALEQAALAALYGKQYQQNSEPFHPEVGAQIQAGLNLSGVDVADALFFREELLACLTACFDKIDVLLCPTAPVTAWKLTEPWPSAINGSPAGPRDHAVFTWIINQVFAPACSVPCGLDDKGLPVGIQVIAPRFCDSLVLEMSKRLQEVTTEPFGPSSIR